MHYVSSVVAALLRYGCRVRRQIKRPSIQSDARALGLFSCHLVARLVTPNKLSNGLSRREYLLLANELAEVRGLVAEDVVVIDVIKDPELVV